jgi:hypothetical protein
MAQLRRRNFNSVSLPFAAEVLEVRTLLSSGTPAGPLQINAGNLTNSLRGEVDLKGVWFQLGADQAAPGDQVAVTFTVKNRGGADPGNFQVEVVLAATNVFDPSAQVLATLQRADLVTGTTGRDFSSPATFQVTLPALLGPGREVIGLRIIPDPSIPDVNPRNNGGLHAGRDYQPLTVVLPVPPGETDLSSVDPGLDTRAVGTLFTSGQVESYSFTITSALGRGKFVAEVAATSGTLHPRLTLTCPQGQVPIDSDHGRIGIHLSPGTYTLSVSAKAGVGAYRLTTTFTPSTS